MDYRNFMRYLRIEKRVSAHTLAAYTLDLDQVNEYLSAEWGHGDSDFPKTLHLRSWLISLMEKGLQARSINRKISTLKTYFKFMIRDGLHPGPDPCRALQRPKTPKNLPRSVSIGSMERLLGEGLASRFHRIEGSLCGGIVVRLRSAQSRAYSTKMARLGPVECTDQGHRQTIQGQDFALDRGINGDFEPLPQRLGAMWFPKHESKPFCHQKRGDFVP